MEFIKLGNSGLEVSRLCLGTMAFGRWISEEESVAIINKAISLGINFIDTANFYGKGQDAAIPYGNGAAEEIIGRAIRNRREQLVVATKVGLPMGHGRNRSGLSRLNILREVDNSLRRLQTDYIDLYQLHFFDNNTPLEETLSTLNDLVHQGKIRYIGCSNFAAWQIAKAQGICERLHLEKFISVQPPYNLLSRAIEQELFPYCQSEEVGIITYSPLARGLLSGKYKNEQDFPAKSRASYGEARLLKLFTKSNFQQIEQYQKLAKMNGVTLSQFALSWVLNKPLISSAIVGASNIRHISDAIEISDWKWSNELLSEVNDIYNEKG